MNNLPGPGVHDMKRLISVLSVLGLLAVVVALPACNTAKGFGQDIEAAGSSIKKSAEKHGAD